MHANKPNIQFHLAVIKRFSPSTARADMRLTIAERPCALTSDGRGILSAQHAFGVTQTSAAASRVHSFLCVIAQFN